jgi:hypothetical protein
VTAAIRDWFPGTDPTTQNMRRIAQRLLVLRNALADPDVQLQVVSADTPLDQVDPELRAIAEDTPNGLRGLSGFVSENTIYIIDGEHNAITTVHEGLHTNKNAEGLGVDEVLDTDEPFFNGFGTRWSLGNRSSDALDHPHLMEGFVGTLSGLGFDEGNGTSYQPGYPQTIRRLLREHHGESSGPELPTLPEMNLGPAPQGDGASFRLEKGES